MYIGIFNKDKMRSNYGSQLFSSLQRRELLSDKDAVLMTRLSRQNLNTVGRLVPTTTTTTTTTAIFILLSHTVILIVQKYR